VSAKSAAFATAGILGRIRLMNVNGSADLDGEWIPSRREKKRRQALFEQEQARYFEELKQDQKQHDDDHPRRQDDWERLGPAERHWLECEWKERCLASTTTAADDN
ncbi:hypothetical protein, partial [Trinickia soli]|uniref:hypothetical protein n=1 Tax=Trinickia soli TaxID=380675 RepID=UPI003FA3D56B